MNARTAAGATERENATRFAECSPGCRCSRAEPSWAETLLDLAAGQVRGSSVQPSTPWPLGTGSRPTSIRARSTPSAAARLAPRSQGGARCRGGALGPRAGGELSPILSFPACLSTRSAHSATTRRRPTRRSTRSGATRPCSRRSSATGRCCCRSRRSTTCRSPTSSSRTCSCTSGLTKLLSPT